MNRYRVACANENKLASFSYFITRVTMGTVSTTCSLNSPFFYIVNKHADIP